MTRALFLATIGLVLHALEAGLAVAFSVDGLSFAPAIVLIAYAALVEPPVEAAVTAALLGLVLDAVSGSPLGLNMLACIVALLVGRMASRWVSAPRGAPVFVFTAILSAGYHLLLLLILVLFSRHRALQGVFDVVTVAIFDGATAIVLIPMVQWSMVTLGIEERNDTLESRLSRRVKRR